MNRTELVQAVSERAGVTKADADRVLAAMAEVVGETIAKDEKVSIPGFLTFERAFRAARTARGARAGRPGRRLLSRPGSWGRGVA